MNKIEAAPAPTWVQPVASLIRHLPAGRYRLMNWLARRPSQQPFWMSMATELGGLSFECDLRDAIAREVCFTGRYEPQDTALVQALLKPGMTFVDVGANWGYYTLLAAHLVGEGGQVVSLEPDPRLFPILMKNIRHNQLAHVIALQIAAAAGAGNLTLSGYNEDDANRGLSRLVEQGEAGAQVFQVEVQAIDTVLDEHGIGEVHLLKMDIEGAEEMALRGMSEGLASHRFHRILLELHPTMLAERGIKTEDILHLMMTAGYQGWWLDFSPSANRRAAYARTLNFRDYIRPLDILGTVDAWPHILWQAPGLELPES